LLRAGFYATQGNADHGRCFAYAVFEPAADAPGFLLRRAMEELGGNPPVVLAASDHGALMVVFATPADRECALARFPLQFERQTITLERPEDGANRAAWQWPCFAHLSATGFPMDHWDAHSIRAAFSSVGSICCIDPLCLDGLEFSAIRLVVKLANDDDVPPVLLVHDAFTEWTTEVQVRLVRSWACDGEGHFYGHYDVDDGSGGARQPRLNDIDDDSVIGAAPSPPRATPPPPSSVLILWGRIVARRQSDQERASALESVDGLPANCGFPLTAPPTSPPTELWDQILAR
jgi:hypothetical protein